MKILAIIALFLVTISTSYAPPIRSVTISGNQFIIDADTGTTVFNASAIPPTQNTIAQIEAWVNGIWIPAHITGYQAQIHIFSLSPINFTVGTWNLGEPIQPNWWNP